MKDLESNAEALTRQVREAAKPEKKKRKNLKKRKQNRNKSTKKKNKETKKKTTKGKKQRKGTGKRRRKENKGNRKKGKKGKRKKSKRRGNRVTGLRSSDTCSDISCLNNLLQVLKVDKDTVANFMQQKKRMDSRLKLLLSKNNKSSKVNESLDHLALALGGNQSLRNNTPVCGGRYNNSDAQEVQRHILRFINICMQMNHLNND